MLNQPNKNTRCLLEAKENARYYRMLGKYGSSQLLAEVVTRRTPSDEQRCMATAQNNSTLSPILQAKLAARLKQILGKYA